MKGRIYFILCEPMEAIKIGFTRCSPRDRLRALQTGCPARLVGIASVPGTQDEEQRLHRAFAPLHIHGEWFRLEGKLLDFACFIKQRGTHCNREAFEDALHDVLMQSMWTWNDAPPDGEDYYDTGDWEPFRHLLWAKYGPWEDA